MKCVSSAIAILTRLGHSWYNIDCQVIVFCVVYSICNGIVSLIKWRFWKESTSTFVTDFYFKITGATLLFQWFTVYLIGWIPREFCVGTGGLFHSLYICVDVYNLISISEGIKLFVFIIGEVKIWYLFHMNHIGTKSTAFVSSL